VSKQTAGYCAAAGAPADPGGETKRLLLRVQKKFTIHHRNKRKPLHVKGHAVKGDGIKRKEEEMLDTKMQIVFRGKLCHRETLHVEKRN